ncbi:integrase [Nostoc sp. T09]|uniref:tyrosine-type recombinase/integrase n=1 Tax=Nostoc sp. T09 TaxID=1932621 RepID=UPI000A3B5677|nr:tyrosine-type recombinase/integrase [Nostoc sp. T09]OUL33125.1 integrase [Nostoc sp. T09]
MKKDRQGQAALLHELDYSKIRRQIRSQKYKILLDLARYTGEKWGSLIRLKVDDVYQADGSPSEFVIFGDRNQTDNEIRQIPLHDNIQESLRHYKPSSSIWLFPSRDHPENHITLKFADLLLRQAVAKAGLESRGISTHSTRITFITKLYRNGTDIEIIQRITGYQDQRAIERYLEDDTDRIKGAIATL